MHGCSHCLRQFAAAEHLAQHQAATKHIECSAAATKHVECSMCNKTFAADEHLAQHQAATMHFECGFECGTCGKTFKAAKHMQQHQRDTGHGPPGSAATAKKKHRDNKNYSPPRKPPFEGAEGFWVKRADFEGRKSFGIYYCECSASWLSAHAHSAYRQECKTCRSHVHPSYMWINSRESSRSESAHDGDKPHMRDLCEACKLGVCTE